MSAKNVEIVTARGTESFIPLNKLKKSPNSDFSGEQDQLI
jgi:ParB family chromosome partitioning protein